MNEYFYDSNVINENIKNTSKEIEKLLEQKEIDKKKYTKLMFQQLIQGLYLQNINM